ncbi:conserved hypothetical protein [Ricinus communis]|uniref:Uncharacterized protein n=1 Tax=Ricinus communis TaxID=3988 RepID=B9TQ27_RICCO|nr:conserved hypothetical protein [Ricinus communis]
MALAAARLVPGATEFMSQNNAPSPSSGATSSATRGAASAVTSESTSEAPASASAALSQAVMPSSAMTSRRAGRMSKARPCADQSPAPANVDPASPNPIRAIDLSIAPPCPHRRQWANRKRLSAIS